MGWLMGRTCRDQAILVKAGVKGRTLCHWSPAKKQGPQLGGSQRWRLQQVHHASMCLPRTRERKGIAGDADEQGGTLWLPLVLSAAIGKERRLGRLHSSMFQQPPWAGGQHRGQWRRAQGGPGAGGRIQTSGFTGRW